jgi:hypothetical protein
MRVNKGKIAIKGDRKILTEEIYHKFYDQRFTASEFAHKMGKTHKLIRDLTDCKIVLIVDKTENNLNIYQLSPDIIKKAKGW